LPGNLDVRHGDNLLRPAKQISVNFQHVAPTKKEHLMWELFVDLGAAGAASQRDIYELRRGFGVGEECAVPGSCYAGY
jgi:hypothetical protein